jgi:hypothetical protein
VRRQANLRRNSEVMKQVLDEFQAGTIAHFWGIVSEKSRPGGNDRTKEERWVELKTAWQLTNIY